MPAKSSDLKFKNLKKRARFGQAGAKLVTLAQAWRNLAC